ncbi:uncharacterized protein HNQ77_002810 [Silvibacterium bohemicum]|uniref:TPM domain-containing protein n=1 Tax=Silvibacterium bohemicum TaxID=1577686 RepID=A0A841K3M0_9BACT|nr:TPM domain-containing protein [Silvibacterium bohemicum]MBB6144854.1 uncharacterized protein [Silvibacterium bohemicum]
MVRKIAFRGVFALLACFATVFAFAEPVKSLPRPTDYVSDLAHVMSPEVKQRINLLCGQVDHQAHAQIAVVTIHSTDGEPIQQYAVDLEDAWGVGPKKSDRGVIILLAVNDRKRWIATGYGLEGILPDARVGDIGRQMVPYLRANDFDGAVTAAVNPISQIIATDAGITLTPLGRRSQQPQQIHISLFHIIVFGIFLILVLVFLVRTGGSGLIGFLLGMFLGGGGRGGGGGDGDGGGSGFGGFGGGSTGGGGAGGDW